MDMVEIEKLERDRAKRDLEKAQKAVEDLDRRKKLRVDSVVIEMQKKEAKKSSTQKNRSLDSYSTTRLVTEVVRRILNGEVSDRDRDFVFRVFECADRLSKEND